MHRKRIFKFFCFCIIFFVLQFCIGWLLTADYTDFGRAVIHGIEQEKKVEDLFLGNSHIYRAVDPEYIQEKTGNEAYICASPGLDLDGSYALLKYAHKIHPEIKNVYVDIDPELLTREPVKNKTGLKQVWKIGKYIKDPAIKYNYLFNTIPARLWPNIFLKIGKDKFVLNPKKIKNTIKAKLQGNYYSFKFDSSSDLASLKKGHVPKNKNFKEDEDLEIDVFEDDIFNQPFDINSLNPDWFLFVKDIINYCNDNNLNIVFFSLPEAFSRTYAMGNYEELSSFLSNFFHDNNCLFYDINLCKKEYLSLDHNDYYDVEHLNESGAEKVSSLLSDLLTAKSQEETEKYFYKSFKERIDFESEAIYGINIVENLDLPGCEFIPIAHKKDNSKITWNYYLINNKKEKSNMMLNSTETIIKYPPNTYGSIEVDCYLNDQLSCKIIKKFDTRWLK